MNDAVCAMNEAYVQRYVVFYNYIASTLLPNIYRMIQTDTNVV